MPEPDRPDLEFRLSRPDWWLRQPLAGLWLHPWFDGLSLYTIGHWYLVLSRAWAAALVAEGDVDRFWQALPGAPSPVPGLGRALRLARQRAQDYDALERAWLEALFQDGTDEAGRLALTRRSSCSKASTPRPCRRPAVPLATRNWRAPRPAMHWRSIACKRSSPRTERCLVLLLCSQSKMLIDRQRAPPSLSTGEGWRGGGSTDA